MKKNIFVNFLVIIFILLPFSKGEIVRAANNYIDVLVIEDAKNSYDITEKIKNVLGFYRAKGTFIKDLDYTLNEVYNYDKVIVISDNANIKNVDLLFDLKEFNGDVFWIGSGVSQILNNDINNDKDKHGIVWHIENIWNMIIIPNESESFFIFNSLNDFFKKENYEEFKTFLKITDVHILSDLDKLKEMADYLNGKNIPFIVVINENEIDSVGGIDDRNQNINSYKIKEFFKTIKYMEDKGGSVVIKNNSNIYEKMNGFIRKDYLKDTNDDYEALESFIKECVKNNVYPLGLELSKDEIKKESFENLTNIFTTFTYSFYLDSNLRYPFIMKDYKNTYNIIADNIGVIDGNNKMWIEDIEYNIKRLLQIKGSVGSISFNSSLDIEYLKELVKIFNKLGLGYIDLKYMNNKVILNDLEISSSKGNVSYKFDEYDKKENSIQELNIKKNFFESKLNNILIFSIIILSLIFFSIYYYFNNNKNTR